MKHLSAILLFSIITILNCAGPKQDDLSGLLLLLAGGGGGNSFHCGQTVANPVPYSTTTNQPPASVSDFITAAGGNNCGSASLVDNDDGTVTDTQNKFLWTLCTAYNASPIQLYDYVSSNCNAGSVVPADRNITQSQAVAFCESLTFAGHSDWILPDAIQLDTLYTTTTPFSLGSFGTKESLKRLGVVWASTQTNDSIVHAYTNGTASQRFVAIAANSTTFASLICVAKI